MSTEWGGLLSRGIRYVRPKEGRIYLFCLEKGGIRNDRGMGWRLGSRRVGMGEDIAFGTSRGGGLACGCMEVGFIGRNQVWDRRVFLVEFVMGNMKDCFASAVWDRW